MSNTVTVEIAGRSYQLRTDEDPEYFQELANYVTIKVLEIKRDSGASALDCATMAALDIADRYFKEEQKKKPAPKKKPASPAPTEPTTLL
ncbi:MAG: cell division protein ZapA [Oscillospiraceae bacterium]